MNKIIIAAVVIIGVVGGFWIYKETNTNQVVSPGTEAKVSPTPKEVTGTFEGLEAASASKPVPRVEQEAVLKRLEASSTAPVMTKNQQLDLLKALEAGSAR
ncbi:MAG: hypothetical protein RLZZ67_273 [Candidatus Parcubacteria bacterium]|jgi:hypothetical protein